MTAELVASPTEDEALNVHPYADRFPMLPADELEALADDIAANGQIHPITLWIDPETGEEMLLDGRNRLAACALARVEPIFEHYGGDPYSLIRSENNRRRQMTPGQSAMADAFALFDQGLRLKGKWKYGAANVATLQDSNGSQLSRAGAILDEDPGLAQQVLAGIVTLPKAYEEVNEKRARRAKEGKQRSTLADTAPDLAAFVTSGKLTLDEAWAAYEKRTQEKRERDAEIEKGFRTYNFSVAECVYKLAGYDIDRFVAEVYPRHAEFVEPGMRLTPERVAAAAQAIQLLAKAVK